MNSVYSTPNPRGRWSLPPKEIKSNHPCFPIPGNTEPPDIPRESINNYGFTPLFHGLQTTNNQSINTNHGFHNPIYRNIEYKDIFLI